MKKLLGFAILGLSLCGPAHAQRVMSGSAGITSSGIGATGGGGAAGGAVGGAGTVTFRTLPSYPRAQLEMLNVSGGDPSFLPSSFVQFEQGIAEGEAALAVRRKTLGDVASENRSAKKPKAQLMLTQDHAGNAVIERR